MKLHCSIQKGSKGFEITKDTNGLHTTYNFINYKDRVVSTYWKSKQYKTLRGALSYGNKFLNN